MTDAAIKTKQEWAKQFWAKRQKEADAAGIDVFIYMAQSNDGILKNTMRKLLLHAKNHPKVRPSDCAFQASTQRLKEHYSVK